MRIVVVADYFFKDRPGGSERSLEAILSASPFEIHRLKSTDFRTRDFGPDDFIIFGNFYDLQLGILPEISKRLKYAVIESDFKYCRERGPDIHKLVRNEDCNCHTKDYGKRIFKFYEGAKALFWKSDLHIEKHIEAWPGLADCNNVVLSPTYTPDELQYLLYRARLPKLRFGWAVFEGDGWHKGHKEAVDYCRKNHLWRINMRHGNWFKVMNKLSRCKGLVFTPNAMESASRIAIEARIMGLNVIVNKKVPVAQEPWFNDTPEKIVEYLSGRTKVFWDEIKNVLS